ncbi:putative methyltransferase-like protein 24 [Saccoglossus kowalevskii]
MDLPETSETWKDGNLGDMDTLETWRPHLRTRNKTCHCEIPRLDEKPRVTSVESINERHAFDANDLEGENEISKAKPSTMLRTQNWTLEAGKEFIRFIYNLNVFRKPRFYCNNVRRVGTQLPNDGGWFVCFDEKIKPNFDDCVVYSFGIRTDWTFDEEMAQSGCKVYSHDPSIGLPDHKHSERVWFYNTGLDAYNSDDVGRIVKGQKQHWKMRSLDKIFQKNGHTDRIIEYLKFDIEKSELAAIPQMLETGALVHVKQLAFEFHIFGIPEKHKEERYLEINNILNALNDHGFLSMGGS